MTKNQTLFSLIIISSSVSFLGASLYFPAMPEMALYFNVSDNVIEHTVSTFQIGLVLAAIVYGPISDSYGRRKILLLGYGIFLLGSILLLLPLDIDNFLLMRFIQGCGSGVSLGLSQAIIRDHFNEKESAKLFAQMGVVIVLTPAIAPILGGYLTVHFGWQSCFLVTAIIVFCTFVALYLFFEETHAKEERTKLHPAHLLKNYKQLLAKPSFIFYSLMNSLLFSSLWFYRTIMPFIFIKYMGVGVENFGYYVFAQIIMFSAASFYIQRVMNNYHMDTILNAGLILSYVGCFIMLLASLFAEDSPILITLSYLPFTIGLAFILPISGAKAMSYGEHSRGSASSFMATTRQLFTTLGSVAAALLPSHNFIPAIIFMLIVSIIMSICFHLAKRYGQPESE